MRKLKAVLLAAAVTAGLPAMASAQRWDRDGNGNPQNEQRGPRDRDAPRPAADGSRPETPRPDRDNDQRGQQDQARAQAEQVRIQQEQARAQQDQARAQQTQARVQQDQARGQQAQNDQRRQQFDRDRRAEFGARDRGDVRPDGYRGQDLNRGFDPRSGNFRQDNNRGPDTRPDFRGDRRPDFRGDPRGGGFSRDWRQDRRYDWQGYRNQNRSIFRGPRYVAPRSWGYGYRPFSIGIRIPSFFFGEQYWIGDPSYYRLPPAYGPYRWIRYYNDVLLIDLRSGIVVDSIPNFFW